MYNKQFSIEHVNKKNTYTWVRCNDDSKSPMYRKKFIEKFGGEFVRTGRYWKWEPLSYCFDIESAFPQEKKETQTTYEFTRPDGLKEIVFNFSEYCTNNNLNRSIMYAVMRGERSHHKQFTVIKLY